MALIGAFWLTTRPLPTGCNFHVKVALVGDGDALNRYLEEHCERLTLRKAREALAFDVVFIVLYAGLGAVAIRCLWQRTWGTTWVANLRLLWLVPIATGVVDLVENWLAYGALDGSGPLAISRGDADRIALAGRPKWALFAATTAVVVISLIAMLYRFLRRPE